MASAALAVACTDSNGDSSGTGGNGAKGGAASGGSNSSSGGSASGGSTAGTAGQGLAGSAGPSDGATDQFHHPTGDADKGQAVFRFETFGNEGFWTRTLRLPQGMESAKLTVIQALEAGVNFDIESFPPTLRDEIIAEAETDLSPANAPVMNDPTTFMALLEANAVVGIAARNVKTLNGTLDINETNVYAGESVGMTCAFCHGLTDGSVYAMPQGGGIGVRSDGRANHDLNVGASLALGENSRAFYPTLALDLVANKHKSVSRLGVGLGLVSKAATEEEVDSYLLDPELYPVGMFDDAADGNGAPMHNTPLFRADLAAPWGTDGSIEMLQNFNNLVYTALFDPTDLTTEGGRQFMFERGGAAGTEIVDNYVGILASMGVPAGGVNGYPFVGRPGKTDVAVGLAAGAKVEDSLIGIRVDDTALLDLNAYLNSLPAPRVVSPLGARVARGRMLFRTACTSCHNDDQSRFVPQNIVPYNDSVEFFENAPARPALFPSYAGALVADRSAARLAPARNSPGIFDDKLIIVDASNRNQPRGSALPLLLDLARKPNFLHDSSVASLDELLDPTRGEGAPHPFFIADPDQRQDVALFLESLDDQPSE
ncbi:MAG TPA: hypothetical protein VG937_18890 [Polyangiaceae bacterium]|nr:hypothetical protein [Polyangiaceae bacterium]